MANVAKRPDGQWRARYRDAAGKEHARHFARKVDAQRWLDEVTAAVVTGTYVDPRAGRVTLADWSRQWLAGKVNLKPTTRARYENVLTVHVLPTWGPVELQAVTHAGVQSWVSGLTAAGLAGWSVRKAHVVLSGLLDLAVKDGRLAKNPAAGVNLPAKGETHRRYLTAAQVEALADAAGESGRLVVLVLAYCGLRWGELAALRVGRVDLLRRRLDVAEAVAEVDGRMVWGTPKTHERRSVPVPRFLVDELAAHIAGRTVDDLVFAGSRRGGELRNRVARRSWFDAAAARAGLPGLTPHELRHTAASLAVSAGANVKAVQRMLGHASAAMTLDVYADLFDDDLDAVAERLDAIAARTRADYLRTEADVALIGKRAVGR